MRDSENLKLLMFDLEAIEAMFDRLPVHKAPDLAEKREFRSTPRSWKDQTRSRFQWGRHKVSCQRVMEEREEEVEEEIE